MTYERALGYDDISIIPTFSSVGSRDEISLEVKLTKGHVLGSPLMPANMAFQTRPLLEKCLSHGSLVVLHRFSPLEEQLELFQSLRSSSLYRNRKNGLLGVSVGVKPRDYEAVDAFVNAGAECITIDIAHGDSAACVRLCDHIVDRYPHVLLIAGNVCTTEATRRLAYAGADIIKAGLSNGSKCTTKNATGIRVPQFTAVDWSRRAFGYDEEDKMIIADGGIREPADAIKALTRAEVVMAGAIFSCTHEAVGSWTEPAEYAGSSTFKTRYIEGEKELVYAKYTVDELYEKYHDGIRSAISYMGGKNLNDIKGYDNFCLVK